MSKTNPKELKQSLAKKITLEKSQDCVRCGLCLPHCPTFNLKKDERYSPRGRIMMMQAYSQSQFELSEADQYLSTCLNCLNCQSVCPANVDYQSLIHQFGLEKNQNFPNQSLKTLTKILTHPFGNRLALIFLRLIRMFQINRLASFFKPSLLRTILYSSSLVDFVQPRRVKRKGFLFNRDKLTNQQKLVLFAGCGAGFSQSLLDKAKYLFTLMGLEVEKMTRFGCCGALSYHQGDEPLAVQTQKHLHQQFENNSLVLIAQSGCSAHIQSQAFAQNIQKIEKIRNVKNQNYTPSIEYQDLSQFLLKQLKQSNLKFKPWQYGKVLLHLPCSQRYPLDSGVILQLINRIEGLNPKIVDWGCCGGAGNYLFAKPVESAQLANQMITEIEEKLEVQISEFDYLITTNVGCKLQFNSQLNQILKANKQAKKLKILHPIEIFADLIQS